MAKSSNNVLALGVGLNLDPLKDDIIAAANTAKEGMGAIGDSVVAGGQKAGGAAKELGDKVQSMRAQLRQATQDTQLMAEKYGVMSTQAIASAARAGELKDKIGDINTVITAFSADSKFTVVAGAMQQAAGAASIVTGAMGLMGVKSEETAALLLKVQSALALTQGLAQLKEMGAAFTALRAVIVGQVIPSIMAMNTSMMLGIGGAIVAIGAITVAVYKYTESLNDERAALVRLNEAEIANIKNRNILKGIIEETTVMQNEALATSLNQELAANDLSLKAELKKNNEKFASLQNTGLNRGKLLFQQAAQEQAIEEKFQKQAQEIRDKYAKQETDKKKKSNTNIETKELRSIVLSNNRPLIEPQLQPSFKGAKSFNLGLEAELLLGVQMMESAGERMLQAQTKLWSDINKIKEQGIAAVFGTLGATLGATIAQSINGENVKPFEAITNAVLLSLADMAMSIGSAMIAIGTGLLLDPTLGLATGAWTKIAAGTALVAAGGLAKGLISGGSRGSTASASSSNSGGGTSPISNMSNSGNYTPATQGNGGIVITGMIRGNDIKIVNSKSESASYRSLNFG